MSRVLLIEDNQRISAFVERGLRAAGHTVEATDRGLRGLQLARTKRPDLIVLDLGLPDIDGLEVLGRLRAEGDATPVIILTARGEVPDKVVGFQRGADDYLAKPFAFAELLMRIQARLRDHTGGSTGETELVSGDLRLDLRSRRVTTPDLGERELSSREFSLLETLLRDPGRIHSREELLDRVWGINFDPQSNIVEVYIRYLRRKIGSARIHTVRGGGYRIASEDERRAGS